MQSLSDEQLHNLVERVVRQTLGGMMNPVSAPVPAAPATVTSPNPVIQEPLSLTALIKKVNASQKVVAIGADHGGVDLKIALVAELTELGYEVIDCGTNTKVAVDYPDIALSVAKLVASVDAKFGVVIDGAGIGSCMSANKVPGVRAAMCYDISTAINSREHNNANVLTLGAGLIGVNLAKAILKTWLTTEFGGGRHAVRVDKINAIEKSYLKEGK